MKHIVFSIGILLSQLLSAQENTHELNARAAVVVPVFYGLHPDQNKWITPELKLSYLANLQYKTTKNWLWETEFQPYSFYYTGPLKVLHEEYPSGSNGSNPVMSSDTVYQKFNFKYLKIHLGAGKQFNFKKGYFSFTFGFSFFTGSMLNARTAMHIQTFSPTGGTPRYHGYLSSTAYDSVAVIKYRISTGPFMGAAWGYHLSERFSLIMGINYTVYVPWPIEGGGTTFENPVYTFVLQQLVSASVGVKFRIMH